MADQAIQLKSVTNPTVERPDLEVPEKAQRRQFSAAYKQRILEEADRCTELGQIGALLRREELYSSHLSTFGTVSARMPWRPRGGDGNPRPNSGRPSGSPSWS